MAFYAKTFGYLLHRPTTLDFGHQLRIPLNFDHNLARSGCQLWKTVFWTRAVTSLRKEVGNVFVKARCSRNDAAKIDDDNDANVSLGITLTHTDIKRKSSSHADV